MLRICALAPARIAWLSSGKCRRTNGWLAVSLFLAKPPIDSPAPRDRRGRTDVRERETCHVHQRGGALDASFIRSSRLVPPAR